MLNTPRLTNFASPVAEIFKIWTDVNESDTPSLFTFPFFYTPHPLCIRAAEELQTLLNNDSLWDHNFGSIDSREEGANGKMFGVLIASNQKGQIGYLSAYSGQLENEPKEAGFVPFVYSTKGENHYFNQGVREISTISARIEELESSQYLSNAKHTLSHVKNEASLDLESRKALMRSKKAARKARRQALTDSHSGNELQAKLDELIRQSLESKAEYRFHQDNWNKRIEELQQSLQRIEKPILELKELRKAMSSALQKKLFDHYVFLNANGESKNLSEIFISTSTPQPPAGAGDCAAPKLLQYAFLNDLKPLAIAEFWWGQSPLTVVRKSGNYYPACRGKCEPILGHMLQGLNVEPNPILGGTSSHLKTDTIFEDAHMIVVNKPSGLLSVPGINHSDSVLFRMEQKYPEARDHMIVHRLDMATSGLLVLAKTKSAHQHLQRQFIKRKVTKQYTAILDGVIREQEGTIDLPLRVDLDDRPRQMVCHEHGKKAQTRWEVQSIKNGRTRIHFFPLTGRSHQLRVHAAHTLGLNTPIVGDDLYGKSDSRLLLHAETLTLSHPISGNTMTFQAPAPF